MVHSPQHPGGSPTSGAALSSSGTSSGCSWMRAMTAHSKAKSVILICSGSPSVTKFLLLNHNHAKVQGILKSFHLGSQVVNSLGSRILEP